MADERPKVPLHGTAISVTMPDGSEVVLKPGERITVKVERPVYPPHRPPYELQLWSENVEEVSVGTYSFFGAGERDAPFALWGEEVEMRGDV